jgi:hypothetical protein
MVVTFYEVKNWTPDLRTTLCFHCSTVYEWWERFPPLLSLNNRQHLSQFTPSLLDHLTPWPVCSKLRHMGPSRTLSENSIRLKYSLAPKHKDLPQIKLNSLPLNHA